MLCLTFDILNNGKLLRLLKSKSMSYRDENIDSQDPFNLNIESFMLCPAILYTGLRLQRSCTHGYMF
jgi:hypothetical protein